MPKENKKRGRHGERKRKREEYNDHGSSSNKKLKDEEHDSEEVEILLDGSDAARHRHLATLESPGETPFYGLLDDEEQEYFRRADEMLEVNQFADVEERTLFLTNVYREANGKELKIASSQSCSRLMERLILLSTADQLKALFGKFSGHFLHLVQHRFASHCCETLFISSAPIVTKELTAPLEEKQISSDGEVFVSMENLFLHTLNELEGNLGYLMTDRFASHALRVLLVILSGRPLAKSSTASLLASKRNENIGVVGIDNNKTDELGRTTRSVPESFQLALDKMIADTVAGLDTTYLRALAAHPVGNPVLQLLLELELAGSGKQKAKDEQSLFLKLLPDNPPQEGTESASFIQGMVYDPVGSRLLETIVRCSPGKTFKVIYKSLFKERLGSLARNETAGFLVERILERLSKEDLEEAIQAIIPQIGSLVERSRTSLIKTMIERCTTRNVETGSIAEALQKAYGTDPRTRLEKMLKLSFSNSPNDTKDAVDIRKDKDPEKLHGSLLAQTILSVPGSSNLLILDSLLALSAADLLHVAKDQTASHVLQASLGSINTNTQFRRKLVQKFYGHVGELALHAIGSHVVDCFWTATQGLAFIQERIAEELLADEAVIRESFVGRAVWRNWKMDLYKRRKLDWINQAKFGGDAGGGSVATLNIRADPKERSGIELAREKFAAAKARKSKNGRLGSGTGANGISAPGRRIDIKS